MAILAVLSFLLVFITNGTSEKQTKAIDTFLANGNLQNEEVSFQQDFNLNRENESTPDEAPVKHVIAKEKIANPSQRYRDVDIYLFANKDTNLYEKDDVNSKVLGRVSYADYVHQIGKDPYNNDGFSKVEIKKQEGFILTTVLTDTVLFKETDIKAYPYKETTVYKDSSLKGESFSIPAINEIKVTGVSPKLLKISTSQGDGYILKSQVSYEVLFNESSAEGWILEDTTAYEKAIDGADVAKTILKYDQVKKVGEASGWYKLELADGSYVYTKSFNYTTEKPISDGEELARYAQQFVGNPYVWGGTSLTDGADCSGFVMTIFEKWGVSMPHGSDYQMGYGREVSYEDAKPGDLFFYPGHVAIYIGDGEIVHASNSAPYPEGGIKISSATYQTPISIRRILD